MLGPSVSGIRTPRQETLVSIRPERIEFKPEVMPAPTHRIAARVLDVICRGDALRLRLSAGSDDFVMKCRDSLGQRRFTPGALVEIGWRPRDASALDPL